MVPFQIKSDYKPAGDQPEAIEKLVKAVGAGQRHSTLLGVTGSGKTFTMANVIERVQRPTLILSHNKTLAAQLFAELRALFPANAVEYFISYYDYYQPEAYVPSSDLFIEKDSSVNEHIDMMRHRATRTLFERNDVVIVASVSCIYGLGSPEAYEGMLVFLQTGLTADRNDIIKKLVEIQYERKPFDFHRGTFRATGDVLEIFPAWEEGSAVRVEFFGDEVEAIRRIDPLRGTVIETLEKIAIYPASHYVTPLERRRLAVEGIREELRERLTFYKEANRLVEAQRLEMRTMHDLELIEQLGFCPGIENYSRHLTGRAPGQAPPCLLDYFPPDFLCFIDESHVTVPQLGAMYRGDRSRKETLVEYGFRLPSALDNRPLSFAEWEAIAKNCVYVSATPSAYELRMSGGITAEQLIRPTGIVDPQVETRPVAGQVDDLLGEIRRASASGMRVLVTTLTKRMSEDLTDYYRDLGVKVAYLHSEVEALERIQLLRELRQGKHDVLVGINLLREGLDLPEVGLVAVLDADKEGFLRGETALIQTIGRAARNVQGRVILYADTETEAIRKTLAETGRRREKQAEYNAQHGITPRSTKREMGEAMSDIYQYEEEDNALETLEEVSRDLDIRDLPKTINDLRGQMRKAAKELDFERAAQLRDRIRTLEAAELELRNAGG